MITKRIIPCLDVRNGRVVKGVNFEGVRDVSSPVELGKFYSDSGADELEPFFLHILKVAPYRNLGNIKQTGKLRYFNGIVFLE